MLGWALRLLLLFLLVRALMLIVGGLLRGLMGVPQASGGGSQGAPRTGREPQSRGTLVKDPVCGTYVPQERALTARTASGGTAFFCSEACRSAYPASFTERRSG